VLSAATRKALLEGRWDVFEGAVFSEWDYNIHTCQQFRVPDEWQMWRGADDGYAAPCAVLWFAHDSIHDRLYVVDELYQSGLTPEEMALAVLAIDEKFGVEASGGSKLEEMMGLGSNGGTVERDIDGIIDSASFADVGMTGATGRGGGRADIMNRLSCRWKPSPKGEGSRLAGKTQIHARLASKNGSPGLVIFRNCRNLIRTLPALCYSKIRPEDVDTDAEDHCYDALRYGLTRYRAQWHKMRVTGL